MERELEIIYKLVRLPCWDFLLEFSWHKSGLSHIYIAMLHLNVLQTDVKHGCCWEMAEQAQSQACAAN